MACRTVRHRLYKDNIETPWFVDKAAVRAHYSAGYPVGVYGAGMGEPSPFTGIRIAALFGAYNTVTEGKRQAEHLAERGAERTA